MLLDEVARRGLAVIDEPAARELRAAVPGLTDAYFRQLLRASGIALSPLVEGVRQDSLQELQRTLLAQLEEYQRGDTVATRRNVIEARMHARLAQRRKPTAEREEAILWMTTWLENPAIFAEWLPLRRASRDRSTVP